MELAGACHGAALKGVAVKKNNYFTLIDRNINRKGFYIPVDTKLQREIIAFVTNPLLAESPDNKIDLSTPVH